MWAQGDRRGWWVGKTKNASSSELGDEKASCGELRRFLGFDAPICASGSRAHGERELWPPQRYATG